MNPSGSGTVIPYEPKKQDKDPSTEQDKSTSPGKAYTLSLSSSRLQTNTKTILVIALLILVVAFGGFMVWAIFAPLDEGVPVPGNITVFSQRKVVQHLTGGIVKDILVKDGDEVEEGQVLIVLDDAQAKVRAIATKSEYYGARVLEARLFAERIMAKEFEVPQDIIEQAKDDPRLAEYIKVQQELFKVRRKSLENSTNILREQIRGLEEYIKGIEKVQQSKQHQIEILQGQLTSLRELAKDGYYPRNRLLDLERALADLIGSRSEELANIERARRSIAELKFKILNLQEEFLKDVDAQLSDVHKKVEALEKQYQAEVDTLERTRIRAPVSGIVMNLAIHTLGGVISPGQPIMEIVPKNADLIIEAIVSPQEIDKVHPGLSADLRFTAFHDRNTPTLLGKVIFVSPDRLVDKTRGIPYYLCHVQVTPEELRKLGNKELRPGMPVEVIIKTGERTLWNYLTKPLTDRVAKAMKER
ncbi:MAG: HlyD family type I secretion periplasmic adaptor subunit [Syntrophobacterales bacterium]|nr:HlyD family type I secretion periplasmic adaptor subunit [Syntrophobacterales bacterium]